VFNNESVLLEVGYKKRYNNIKKEKDINRII